MCYNGEELFMNWRGIMKKDSFSVLPGESNNSVMKYNKWVRNLEREIRYRADRGQIGVK